MKNKLNERKQTNRDEEQDRDPWFRNATNNNRVEQPQRFIYWDDDPYKEVSGLRKSTGRFTERYFEKEE